MWVSQLSRKRDFLNISAGDEQQTIGLVSMLSPSLEHIAVELNIQFDFRIQLESCLRIPCQDHFLFNDCTQFTQRESRDKC
jgi:hypothetical protein